MDKPKEQFTGNSTTQPGRAIVGSLAPPIGTLDDASLDDLRRAWRRLFHCEPPKISRDLLARHIGYHLQERRHGGLGKATKRKLKTLARSFQSTGQVSPDAGVGLKPGARLVREWHGRSHTVTVTEEGFEYGGATYASLTKIAREITGTHWSGPRFFGLVKGRAPASQEANHV